MIDKIVYNLLITVSNFIFPIILLPTLANSIGAEGIGLSAFYENIIRYGMVMISFGFPISSVIKLNRAISLNEKTEIVSNYVSVIGIFVVIFLSAFTIFFLFFEEYYNFYVIISAAMFICQALSFEYLFQALGQFKFVAVRTLIIRSISLGLIILHIQSKSDLELYFIIILLTNLISTLLNLFYLNKLHRIKFSPKLEIISNQVIYYKIILLTSVYNSLDVVILSYLKGAVSAGYYTSGLKFVRVPLTLIGSISAVVFPELSKLKNDTDLHSRLRQITPILSSFSILSGYLMFFNSKLIVDFLLGPNFSNVEIVIKITSLLIPILTLSQIYTTQALSLLGKEKSIQKILIFGVAFYLISCFYLSSTFSQYGASWALVGTESFILFLTFYVLKNSINFNLELFFERNLLTLLFCLIAIECITRYVELRANHIVELMKISIQIIVSFILLPSFKYMFYKFKNRLFYV